MRSKKNAHTGTALYFIALIPHEALREDIRLLKEEMKLRFDSKHALKSPAHITLQMPFRKPESDEGAIIRALDSFSQGQEAFRINLKGFGCFTPRVIFIQVEDHDPIKALHEGLKQQLLELGFEEKEVPSSVHPHMTIATRDLSKGNFLLAWPEFESREFSASFTADAVYLLKHNGKHWDIYTQFNFGR